MKMAEKWIKVAIMIMYEYLKEGTNIICKKIEDNKINLIEFPELSNITFKQTNKKSTAWNC